MASSVAQGNADLVARVVALEKSVGEMRISIETSAVTISQQAEMIKHLQETGTRAASKSRAPAAPRERAPPTPKNPRAMFMLDWVTNANIRAEYADIIQKLASPTPAEALKSYVTKYLKALKMADDTEEAQKKREQAIAGIVYDTLALDATDPRRETIDKKFNEMIEAKRSASTATNAAAAATTTTTRAPRSKKNPVAAAASAVVTTEPLTDEALEHDDADLVATATAPAPAPAPTKAPRKAAARPTMKRTNP